MTYGDVLMSWAASKLDKAGIAHHGIRNVSFWASTYEEYYDDDPYPCIQANIFYYLNPGRTTPPEVRLSQSRLPRHQACR